MLCGPMFHYDRGLKLTSIDLAIDICRRQPRGFISHAHADHMARHELALCTPVTARLYHHRLGVKHRVRELPFRQSIDWDDTRLTTYPAGHTFGSAMLLAEQQGESLLYTGDFKTGASATAEDIEFPRADTLIMESTFGDPKYRLPPRNEVIERLVGLVTDALKAGRTPVIYAYVLGKSQEVTKILTDHGFPVQQHRLAFEVSRIYQDSGCDLGEIAIYDGTANPGHALVVPPRHQRSTYVPLPARRTTIATTGWAMDRRARYRLGVDHALPLSDHADFDGLMECVQRVQPRVVYCTHGPAGFVEELIHAGYDARLLGE